MAEGAPASTGGLSPADVGAPAAGQAGGKRSAWIAHVKKYASQHGIKFGDALSKAGPSFKKHGGGGMLGGLAGPMGGRRRRGTKKAVAGGKRHRGGAQYGFGGDLSDGNMAYGHSPDSTWKGGDSTLTGSATGSAPAAGGRRTRRRRRNNKKGTASGGKRRHR